MEITLTAPEFFEYGDHCLEFDAFLYKTTSTKSTLKLELSEAAVTILADTEATQSVSRIGLAGLSQYILAQRTPNASQVFYPLIGQVKTVDLPASKIFSLRSHRRSIADFWARNIFHALSSASDVEFEELSHSASSNCSNIVSGFSKNYLWALRDALPDAALSRPDIFEKVTLDFYFPVLTYENQILGKGMQALRRLNAKTVEAQRASDQERQKMQRFDTCRRDLLELLTG